MSKINQDTILIIEDNTDLRDGLESSLELSGYNVIIAETGEEGIRLAHKIIPDLIICDIMLPTKDGYDVIEEIQSADDLSDTPFLFLSAKSSPENIRKGMHLGADDYITKPYELDDLLNSVKTRLKRKKSRLYNEELRYKEIKKSVSRYIPHEIRTPLNIIMGLSEYLIKNADKSNKNDLVDMLMNINDAGRRLSRLFENYLLYANLELIRNSADEKKKLRREKTPLIYYLLKDLIHTHLKNYGRISDLKMEIEDTVLSVSEKYLSKIVYELIDNAVKFSEAGSPILIKSEFEDEYYVINCIDNGRGMTKEQIDTIDAYLQFERKFYEQQGSGLGLSIVKMIAELHCGKIQITSEPGKYTNVKVFLPVSS
jgi:two-component system sensor histidine kinase/response regulator